MTGKSANCFLVAVVCFLSAASIALAQIPPMADDKSRAVYTLSESQKQTIKRIQDESGKRAAPIALKFAAVVRKLYEDMLAEKPDEKLRGRLDTEMKEATWELLAIKGQSIRETVKVLTPVQKQRIRSEMRKPGAPADLSDVIAQEFHLTAK